jgi:hypothetical protein
VFNPFTKIDQLLEKLISNEDWRIAFQIFIWPLAYWVLWALLINLGPFLVFYIILYATPIYIFTRIGYKRNPYIVFPLGLLFLSLVGGVPWGFSGLLVKLIKIKAFVGFSTKFVLYWWKGLNHLWPFTDWVPNKNQYDLDVFMIRYIYWGSGIILPLAFTSLFDYLEEQKPFWERDDFKPPQEVPLTPEEAEAQAAWRIEHDKFMEERRLKDEAKALEEKRLQEKLLEEKRQAEIRARLEAERLKKEAEEKRLKKIEEVRGKNPWDSGFL